MPISVKDALGANVEVPLLSDIDFAEQTTLVSVLDALTLTGIKITSAPLPTGAATDAGLGAIVAAIQALPTEVQLNALTNEELRASAVPVTGSVTVSNFPGSQPVTIASLPLPTNAATSALQTAGNTSLATIANRLPALGRQTSANSLSVTIASDQGVIPVVVSSAVLPPGAATSENQGVVAGEVHAINLKTPALGQAASAASVPVVLSSDQPAVPVSGTFFPPTQQVSGTVAVTGTVGVSNFPATQPVSAAALPLPNGAATNASLVEVRDRLPATAHAQPLTDTQLRATPLNITGTVTTTPTADAATATNQLNTVGDYAPGYDAEPEGSVLPSSDPDGQTKVRGPVMTDEGGYRFNFSGSTIARSIGTCTFTNGSDVAVWAAPTKHDLHRGDYVYLDSDGAAFVAQVDTFTETEITLVDVYGGAGGTGASSKQSLAHVFGTGQSVVVSAGSCTLTLGTTTAQTVELRRTVDVMPLVKQAGVKVSQRINGQRVCIGLYELDAAPRWFAWFLLDGTDSQLVKVQSARNSGGAPVGPEIEETVVRLASGVTTDMSLRYRVELFGDRANFWVNGVLAATHYKSLPAPYDELTSTIRAENTGTPATSTTVQVDFDMCRNFNIVDTLPGSDQPVAVTEPDKSALLEHILFKNLAKLTYSLNGLRVDPQGGAVTATLAANQYLSYINNCNAIGVISTQGQSVTQSIAVFRLGFLNNLVRS